jgi:multidrug efflux system membrane fusion protein
MRAVTLGVANGDTVAITKGLKLGETVVVDGADRLRDGAEVAVPGTAGAAGATPAKANAAAGSGRAALRAQFEKMTPEERKAWRAKHPRHRGNAAPQ